MRIIEYLVDEMNKWGFLGYEYTIEGVDGTEVVVLARGDRMFYLHNENFQMDTSEVDLEELLSASRSVIRMREK